MNEEQKKAFRKEYNKMYYQKNKEQILERACKKMQCEFCQRSVIAYNFQKHQNTDICRRRQQQSHERKKRLNLFSD